MIWRFLLNSKAARFIGAALAGAMAILAYGGARERKGKRGLAQSIKVADMEEARDIRKEADEIRNTRDGDPVERLSNADRLRD